MISSNDLKKIYEKQIVKVLRTKNEVEIPLGARNPAVILTVCTCMDSGRSMHTQTHEETRYIFKRTHAVLFYFCFKTGKHTMTRNSNASVILSCNFEKMIFNRNFFKYIWKKNERIEKEKREILEILLYSVSFKIKPTYQRLSAYV